MDDKLVLIFQAIGLDIKTINQKLTQQQIQLTDILRDAPEALNTFKEIADWVRNNEDAIHLIGHKLPTDRAITLSREQRNHVFNSLGLGNDLDTRLQGLEGRLNTLVGKTTTYKLPASYLPSFDHSEANFKLIHNTDLNRVRYELSFRVNGVSNRIGDVQQQLPNYLRYAKPNVELYDPDTGMTHAHLMNLNGITTITPNLISPWVLLTQAFTRDPLWEEIQP